MNVFSMCGRRLLHLGIKLASPFLPYRSPKMETYDMTAQEWEEAGMRRVLLITGARVRARGLCEPLLSALRDEGMKVAVFDEVPADPTLSCVEEALSLYREAGCDCIAAVGGGSPMDCAKGVCARVASPKRPLKKMKGAFKVRGKVPPFLAVPTTAGSGSEKTAAAVFTDEEKHEKFAVFSYKLVPKYCVLDPKLTLTLPPAVTADTGMDALTHAVEAYIGRATTEKSREPARNAARYAIARLPVVYENGSDLGARGLMLLVASDAGTAFTLAYVGYVHALAHAVGGAYGVPHGRACGVLLPHVLRAYGAKAEKKLAQLSLFCEFCDEKTPRAEAAERFIQKIEELLLTIDMPQTLPIREEDIPSLARRASREAIPYPVPKLLGVHELEDILRSVAPESV